MASLLSIPPELRLVIYDMVFESSDLKAIALGPSGKPVKPLHEPHFITQVCRLIRTESVPPFEVAALATADLITARVYNFNFRPIEYLLDLPQPHSSSVLPAERWIRVVIVVAQPNWIDRGSVVRWLEHCRQNWESDDVRSELTYTVRFEGRGGLRAEDVQAVLVAGGAWGGIDLAIAVNEAAARRKSVTG